MVVSGLISIALIIFNEIGTFKLCGGQSYGDCMDMLSDAMLIFFPIIPLFIFSLITYKMRDEIFQSWWRFARIWVPISMILILLTPSYTHNWMFPIMKSNVALLLSAIFIIASLIKITLAYRSKK